MDPAAEKKRVCVTGAAGFITSWLVKLLLSKGYIVHGTVREPSDPKNAHLKELHPAATDNLQLFKVDLLDYESVASAITGCEGVFHAASPVPYGRVPNPEIEVIEPAVTGTLNVLKACSEAKVKRVVVVSSVVAIGASPDVNDKILDEGAWSDAEYCRKTEDWYSLSKTLAEREAINYGKRHRLDVVSVCPGYVIGPLLQSAVNPSSLFLISILNGSYTSMPNTSYSFVDVRDVADALFLVYEKPEASGRYICGSWEVKIADLIHQLRSLYPNFKYLEKFTEAENFTVQSEKLEELGWRHRTMKESLVDSVECYRNAGLVDRA